MSTLDQQAMRRHAGFVAWPTICFAVIDCAAFASVCSAAATHALPYWLAGVLNWLLAYGAFTTLHETVHGNIRGSHHKFQVIEKILGNISGIMLFAPFEAFRFLHLTHHAHTNDHNQDPDHWVCGKTPLSTFFRCLSIMPYYLWFFFVLTKSPKAKKLIPSQAAILLGMVAAFLFLSFYFGLLYPMVVWFLPALFAQATLAFVLDWLPHHPFDSTERFTNASIYQARGLDVITMGHNLHLIHHLWPRIPFYRYRQAFMEFRSELKQRGTRIF